MPEQPCEDPQADNHVQRVQAGHYEIEREENLGVLRIGVLAGVPGNFLVFEVERRSGNVVFYELVFVLDAFDAEECAAEEHRQQEH